MKAIRFHYRPIRYLMTRALSGRFSTMGAGRLGSVSLDDVDPPPLPGPDWVRLESRLSGICGSDLGVITAHDSFTLAPFAAYPFTFGHEIVATVAEAGQAVTRWAAGDRVVVNPMLSCAQRGEPPCVMCERGDYGLCHRVGDGLGLSIGFSPLTGGGWSRYLVAHESQLHPQGDLPDETALMTDAFASALKGVLLEPPSPDDDVLVIGAGSIGLLTVAALRMTGFGGEITVSARYGFQGDMARRLGATRVLSSREELFDWASSRPDARSYDPDLAGRFIEGGPPLVYDTVGSESTVRTGLALVRAGGRIVEVGATADLKADWSRVYSRQIRISGAFAYGPVLYRGESRDIYDVSLELIRDHGLPGRELVTHVFELEEYRDAFAVALGKRGHQSIKVAFRPG